MALDLTLRVLAAGVADAAHWGPGSFPAATPFWRCYWCAQRAAWVQAAGQRRVYLDPGQLVVIAPETPYRRAVGQLSTHVFAHFAVPGLASLARSGIYVQALDVEGRARIERLRAAVGASKREGGAAPAASVAWQAYCAVGLAAVPADCWHSPLADCRMMAAAVALTEDLAHPPTNGELAELAGMHKTAFVRAFARAMGLAPQRYLLQERIAEACRLLAGEGVSIEDIAEHCGFHDRAHFTRSFTVARGMAPGRWRTGAAAGIR
ncbi:MAG: AraC family transcriptional regulator [Planctomycetota bacterium]|jgi:AraC-like DNA-binding protein|nr:AraC family transcriptional regulator [Planctomycetota bacterium]